MNFRNDQFRSFVPFLQFVDMYETGFQVSGSFCLNTTDPVPYDHDADHDILHGTLLPGSCKISVVPRFFAQPLSRIGFVMSARFAIQKFLNWLTFKERNVLRVGLLTFLRWLVLM